jgi:hypothetical protein
VSGAVCLLPHVYLGHARGNITFILLPHHRFVLIVTYLLSTLYDTCQQFMSKQQVAAVLYISCISVSVLNVHTS